MKNRHQNRIPMPLKRSQRKTARVMQLPQKQTRYLLTALRAQDSKDLQLKKKKQKTLILVNSHLKVPGKTANLGRTNL